MSVVLWVLILYHDGANPIVLKQSILDKITASDIAYMILVYKNSKEVWEEELEIRGSEMPDDEKRTAIRHKKPKYHEGRGK